MSKIDLTINKEGLLHNIQKAKENNIIIPTIAQMQNPDLIPEKIKEKLTHTGLWDVDPVNLFRISWHNEAKETGGLYQKTPNYVEIPSSVSGVPCRILAMSGKWFPTGCHKVGASFGCLAPRLVTGQFDATYHHAVWPSTGNYCRGGAFNSKLLACDSVAILPQDMSKERFDWLKTIAGQIIATPGCESNVKEIFDKTWELKQDPSMMIFNQFAEMGNPLWHYNVTGYALSDLFENVKKPGQRLAGGRVLPRPPCAAALARRNIIVAADGGKRAIMEMVAPVGPMYQAGTLSGNPLAMAAGIANLTYMEEHNVCAALESHTAILVGGLQRAAEKAGVPVQCHRLGSMFTVFFNDKPVTDYASAATSDLDAFRIYFHSMLEQGIYLPPSQFETNFISLAHTPEDIEKTIAAAEKAFSDVAASKK